MDNFEETKAFLMSHGNKIQKKKKNCKQKLSSENKNRKSKEKLISVAPQPLNKDPIIPPGVV